MVSVGVATQMKNVEDPSERSPRLQESEEKVVSGKIREQRIIGMTRLLLSVI